MRECWQITRQARGAETGTFKTQALLGIALYYQGHHAEAETLLLESHAGLVACDSEGPSRSRVRFRCSVAARLAELYQKCDKPAQAEEWRRKAADEPR